MAAEKSVLQPSLNLPISLSTIFHASIRRLAVGAAVIADASGGAVYLSPSVASSDRGGGQILLDSLRRRIGDPAASVPSRSAQESLLIGANSSNPLNVLVIGGGATGSGVALDAATRGLRLGLVEREDFSLGTSSRSTKLIHGGQDSQNHLSALFLSEEKAASKPTIVLEAVASQDLWIWYAFFGPPDTLNDINVLDRSPIFDDILEGRAPRVDYFVNGRQYNLAYYLTDGIYPKWAIFIQSILFPQGPKASLFAQCQEAARKDVERAFAVLQARFAIVKNPALSWNKIKIRKIMRACIILHNMIVEDERHGYSLYNVSEFYQGEGSGTSHVDLTYSTNMPTNLGNMMGVRNRLRDTTIHRQLKDDLVEHIWQKFGTTSD